MAKDFNNIGQWLPPLLKKKNVSVERFAKETGLSRASIYFYMQDVTRPTEEAMKRMCDALGVPFQEGLRQYTPRAVGRPAGYSPGPRTLTARGRA